MALSVLVVLAMNSLIHRAEGPQVLSLIKLTENPCYEAENRFCHYHISHNWGTCKTFIFTLAFLCFPPTSLWTFLHFFPQCKREFTISFFSAPPWKFCSILAVCKARGQEEEQDSLTIASRKGDVWEGAEHRPAGPKVSGD